MKLKRLLFMLISLLAISLFLVACGSDDSEVEGDADSNSGDGGEATEEAPDFLSILTGGTSGTYYPLGGEMASTITDATGIQTDALSSNASADNVIALQEGEAELAFVQTDVIDNAVNGVNAFEGNKVENVQAIGSLYPETIQIVTTKDSGISSVEDLAGKKSICRGTWLWYVYKCRTNFRNTRDDHRRY